MPSFLPNTTYLCDLAEERLDWPKDSEITVHKSPTLHWTFWSRIPGPPQSRNGQLINQDDSPAAEPGAVAPENVDHSTVVGSWHPLVVVTQY